MPWGMVPWRPQWELERVRREMDRTSPDLSPYFPGPYREAIESHFPPD